MDELGGAGVVSARAGGGLRAVPQPLLRYGCALARRLADDAAVLLRLADRHGAGQALLPAPLACGSARRRREVIVIATRTLLAKRRRVLTAVKARRQRGE